MKTLLLFTLLLFAEMTGAFAANWHPFPFKVAYYGRQVEFGAFEGAGLLPSHGPLYSGKIMEGVYLDSVTNSGSIRRHSAKYQYLYPPSRETIFMPRLGMSIIKTRADSNLVTWIRSGSDLMWESDSVAIPHVKLAGATFSIGTVMGMPDSIATFMVGSHFFVISKNFGLIEFLNSAAIEVISFKLEGVADLGLGWQPYQATTPVLPKPGDEMHYRFRREEVRQPGFPMPGIPTCGAFAFKQVNDYRIKVLEYPYMGDPDKVLYQYIVSDSGGASGVLYTQPESLNSSFSFPEFYAPGVNSYGYKANGYFQDSLGMNLYYSTSYIIDGGANNSFIPCSFIDVLPCNEGIPFSVGCNVSVLIMGYPVYAKFQNGCTMGTPWPPVTITETKSLEQQSVSFFPNPVEDRGYIQIEGMDGGVLNWQLTDLLGRTENGTAMVENGRAEVDFSGKTPGVYTLSVPGSTVPFRQRIVCK